MKDKLKTPYLESFARRKRLEIERKVVYRFYVAISTLLILVTIFMIAINPEKYLNLVVIMLLASVILVATENIHLHMIKRKRVS